jgi:ABC-2 type transport system ATP-binding protein
MVEKNVRCPQCGNILTSVGNPGEINFVTCPECGKKGKVTFKKVAISEDVAIEAINIKKVYGDLAAVNSISFSVNRGEVFAFLGPNGAGKTTTVEMIESIRKPTAGTIKILGKDINKSFDEIKDKIGILPQEFFSFERFTVRETLEYYASLYKKKADIDEIIDMMDLKDQENKLYMNLSGGLKQRVGVAISLVNDPEIVFLDEPSTGLDPKARREVWEVIANLRKKGKTIFLTTHYMEEAEYLADRIVIIHKGQIIAEGALEELISKYGDENILRIKNCNSKDIISKLEQNGFETLSEGNGDIAIKIEYKEQILEILSLLKHECVDYNTIDIRRSNLEEIFLKLTGAKLREAG